MSTKPLLIATFASGVTLASIAFAQPVAPAQAPAPERNQARVPAPAPTIADDAAPPPADDAHSGVRRAMGEGPPVTEARASTEVPRGNVRVRVLRPDGSPIEGATVRLGIMAQSGNRNALHERTNHDGIAMFDDLATGQSQAYRPRVVSGGATYAATPFQLEPDRGHDVVIRVFPASRDINSLLLIRGQAIIELRPERLHVTMQLDVANITEKTYVFPQGGLAIPLPPGATAFQAQENMNDQRLALEGAALRMRGSIPPGRAALVYGYDLPYDGDVLDITLPNPFRTMSFGVAIESTPGLTLEVDDFPTARRVEVEGRGFLVTQLDRAPEDPPLRRAHIVATGIPGKGPYAYIAVFAAALVFAVALGRNRGTSSAKSELAAARKARKEELVELARVLAEERSSGDVGPEHYTKTREALVTELAAILAAESSSKERG